MLNPFGIPGLPTDPAITGGITAGNAANNLATINDLNQARPNGINENLHIEYRCPNLAYSNISATIADGFSRYHGLQMRLEKRSEARTLLWE